VPNVVGLTQTAATNAITGATLTLGTVTTSPSATVPAGSVISQSPTAGTQVTTGSAVALVVSVGPLMIAVPNVVGLTQAEATLAITDATLVVSGVTVAPSSTVPAGSVISQTPAGGAQVLPGSAVALVVSSGPSGSPPPSTFALDTTVFSDGPGTRDTAPFSTAQAGELLVAFVSAEGPSNLLTRQTVTVSGEGLDWNLVTRSNTQFGTAEIWTAFAPGRLTNATITATPSIAGFDQSLTVMAFIGADLGSFAAASGSSRNAPSVSLTTTAVGSLVIGVGVDPERRQARTPDSGQTIIHQWVDMD
jgi:hypothetical protein